jgi:hypothetical protein
MQSSQSFINSATFITGVPVSNHIREFRSRGNPLTFPIATKTMLREKIRDFPSQLVGKFGRLDK